MTCGVRKFLVSSVVLSALAAVAGCSHYLLAEREPWRHDAEISCLNSGAVKEGPTRVRIAAINGPGMCGMDYPLKVSALGESGPLGYDDEPLRPPSPIPSAAMPQQWPGVQSSALPPPQPDAAPDGPPPYGAPAYGTPQSNSSPYGRPAYSSPPYGSPPNNSPQYGSAQSGAPMSLTPPGVAPPDEDDGEIQGDETHPYYNAPDAPGGPPSAPAYPLRQSPPPRAADQGAPPGSEPLPPLGPPTPMITASAGPVAVKPAATLACPIVSVLDQWISEAVQPAALKWFHQPVVEIKQISAYSCRGMNGNPNAHISEHAFGNALDVAEFDLADGHKVSVQYGWHGAPEEQGFLHDVQAAACDDFTTVLAPGANVYHYNHIHVDLMRRTSVRHICEPAAISGEVAAARARARYAGQHYGRPDVTGAIRPKPTWPPLSYSDDDRLPLAVPGDD